MLEAATGLGAAALAADPDYVLSTDEVTRFEALLARRVAREPMAHILGRAGFWTLDLEITPDVLCPRPETEQVLEAALEATCGVETGRVLDLGVGPGTLLLAFLSERPGWFGVGVDLSEAALAVAARNARSCGLADRAAFVCGRWDAALHPTGAGACFDAILSNPPYIASAELDGLEPEVRDHEPRLALDGGADGLAAYRSLASAIVSRLAPGGVGAVEIGAGQATEVAALFSAAAPEAAIETRTDLAGRARAIIFRQKC